MDALNFRYTYTTKFILPLLFENYINYTKVLNESFINAYIADMANNEYDDKIHLLFADYPSLTFQKTLPNPLTEYQHENGYVLVYSLPEKYEEDYIKFLTGAYSKFSIDAKHKILEFWSADKKTLLYGALYREGEYVSNFYKKHFKTDPSTDFDLEAEWWPAPKIEQEILGLAN